MIEVLNENNFLTYAMHHYDNPQCTTIVEFEDDLKRFNYLHKLLIKYKRNGILRERLILNHILILYNLFGSNATNMLFYKIDKPYWGILITFLVYLNRMPETLPNYKIVTSDFELDQTIITALRAI